MKKILAILLAAMMLLTLVGCGNNDNVDTPVDDDPANPPVDEVPEEEVESCTEVFTKIWDLYTEDEKFAAMGGDMDNVVNGAPGAYSLADAENAGYTIKVPADALELVNDCATLMHMMNANTFTGAIMHVADKANVQTVCDKAKETVAAEQWMCGFPDKHLVMVIDESYVLTAFGNIDIMNTFRDKVNASGYSVTEAYWLDIE